MERRSIYLLGGILGIGAVVASAGGLPSKPPGEFFTWEELTTTSHGSNPLTSSGEKSLRALTRNSLDPFRRWFGRFVTPTSGWRSKRVNRKVGGADDSQHMRGEATDFIVPGMTSEQLASAFLRSGVPFDQIVWYAYKPHLHVSYTTRYPLRRQVTFSPAPKQYTMNTFPQAA